MISFLLAVAGTGAFWFWALWMRETRNIRLLSVLAVTSVVLIGAAAIPGTAAQYVQIAAAVFAAVVIIWPGRFGLASLTPTDIKADRSLRDLERALDDAAGPRGAIEFAPGLHAPPFTSKDSPWGPVGRLYRLILWQLADPDPDPDRERRAPTGAFRRAGRHYWTLALGHRVLGRRRGPSAWDEDVLVHTYLDELRRLMSRAIATDDLVDPQDGWDMAAEGLADELTGLPLRHAIPDRNRGLLIDVIRADLALSREGDRASAQERAKAAADMLAERWQAPPEDQATPPFPSRSSGRSH